MNQLLPTLQIEFNALDARMMEDIGLGPNGEGVHPSQLRRLPTPKNFAVVAIELVIGALRGAAAGFSVRAAR